MTLIKKEYHIMDVKIKTSFLIVLWLIVLCSCKQSQNITASVQRWEPEKISITLPLVEIKDTLLTKFLDTVISESQKCSFYLAEEPIYYLIKFISNEKMMIQALQITYTKDIFNCASAYLKYKGINFIICGFLDSSFFINTNQKISLQSYENYKNIFFFTGVLQDNFTIRCNYKNGEIRTEFVSPCQENTYEFYKIKKGDTLASIAKKFNMTDKVLLKINNMEESDFPQKTEIKILKTCIDCGNVPSGRVPSCTYKNSKNRK